MIGTMRLISSSRATGSAPGRVDSPPISKILAPSLAIVRPLAMPSSAAKFTPPSEKLSGVAFTIPIICGSAIDKVAKSSRGAQRRANCASAVCLSDASDSQS